MKELDPHDDYTMYNLIVILRTQLHAICSYMQDTTPYGDEYEAAYQEYVKLREGIASLEDKLAGCVERKINKGIEAQR